MADDRLLSDRDEFKAGIRHDNLALRWESVTGEGRILAKGTEAVTLYQSDMVEGFRSLSGGYMVLGRVQNDVSFRPMIRQAIPLQIAITELTVVPDDPRRTEDGARRASGRRVQHPGRPHRGRGTPEAGHRCRPVRAV